MKLSKLDLVTDGEHMRRRMRWLNSVCVAHDVEDEDSWTDMITGLSWNIDVDTKTGIAYSYCFDFDSSFLKHTELPED